MRTARVATDSTGLDRSNRETRRAIREVERTQERQLRLLNPHGATSGGGGRGGFKGALKDFVQRDEIIGRTGTISRLALSGNVVGTLLAFQSIEEFAAAATRWLKGESSFIEGIRDQVKFLAPSILREYVPEILKATGLIADESKIGKRMARDFNNALNDPDYWDLDPVTGRRVRAAQPPWLKRQAAEWGGDVWQNSEEFRRLVEEGAERGVR